MNIISKTARLAMLSMMAATLIVQAGPASANPNPAFNLSGIWRNSAGEDLQIFQNGERVVIVAVNTGWAQILEGYYYTPKKVHLVNSRITRSPYCQTTMSNEITVVSNTVYRVDSTALESTCGLTVNHVYSDPHVTRVL
jgi:hypothetical protein